MRLAQRNQGRGEVITEKGKRIPVLADVDVVIVGGGTAGVIAAIAAARNDAKTFLMERKTCLGGMMTSGLLTSFGPFHDKKELVVGGIPIEVVNRLREWGGLVGNVEKDHFIHFDPELAKFILDEMVTQERNLKVLFESCAVDAIVRDKEIKAVIVENKSNRQAIRGKVFVDASGDADVAARAGLSYQKGGKNGEMMPVSLLARVANVDVDSLKEFYEKRPDWAGDRSRGQTCLGFHKPTEGLINELEEASKRGELSPEMEEIRHWFIGLIATPYPREISMNMTGAVYVDGTDASQTTEALIKARKRIMVTFKTIKKYIPGFEKSFIVSFASSLGVRETRRIAGEYVLSTQDVVEGKHFDDEVAVGSCNMSFHTANGKEVIENRPKPGISYGIPYRCFFSKKIRNLLVAGRCISATREAIASARTMPTCMAEGQAAGTAAALAVKENLSITEMDIVRLQRTLVAQGVCLKKSFV